MKNFEKTKTALTELKKLCVKEKVSLAAAVMNDDEKVRYALVGFTAEALPCLILSIAEQYCKTVGEDTEKFLKMLIEVYKMSEGKTSEKD